MFKRILVPVDFSDNARKALELAVRLAAETDATLTLVHVVLSPQVYTSEIGMTEVGPVFMEVAESLRAAAERNLDEWSREVVPEPMPRTLVIRQGYPPDEVVAEAEASGCDLIVMGAHGRRGLRGALLGSNTSRVLRHSPVPVMVTR